MSVRTHGDDSGFFRVLFLRGPVLDATPSKSVGYDDITVVLAMLGGRFGRRASHVDDITRWLVNVLPAFLEGLLASIDEVALLEGPAVFA